MSTIPRRAHVERYTSGETAIAKAIEAVEAMGADERLTHAVIHLGHAKDRVADFVDGVPGPTATVVGNASVYAPRYRDIGPCPACKLGAPEIQGKQLEGGAIAFRVICPTCGRGMGHPFQAEHHDNVGAAVDAWKAT